MKENKKEEGSAIKTTNTRQETRRKNNKREEIRYKENENNQQTRAKTQETKE